MRDRRGGSCWYLGAAGDNCTDTCAAQGLVYDPATESYAGSGGTDVECAAVLDLLGVPAGAIDAFPCVSEIGCYYDIRGGTRSRCTNPDTEADAYLDGERACACMGAP